MDDDYADLLGSSSMPVRRTMNGRSWSTVFFFTMAGAIGGMVLYVGLVYLWNLLMKSREKSYKLSMRRHHGIPDSDHRPFNVAYAAARRAREEKEKPPKKQPVIEPRPVPPPQSRPDQALRQRPVEQITRSTSENVPWPGSSRFPGQSSSVVTSHVPPSSIPAPNLSRVTFVDGLDTSASPVPVASSSRRKSVGTIQLASKHQLEDEGYTTDSTKKTRIEGEELIDGDEDPVWLDVSARASRSTQRVDRDGEDVSLSLSQRAREKQPRKGSNDSTTLSDDDMVVDYQESSSYSPSTARGKKRERVDSGSMFGGEGALEAETTREKKRRNKRRSDVNSSSSRGKKRDRDVQDEIEEEADETSPQVIRKKRGKRSQREPESKADSSMESVLERGPRREIGEKWESNGVEYKIGPNGQRLRKTLKRTPQKCPMPVDSIHPDRDGSFEVFVEKWLTEEEYKEAKEQRLLPYQEITPRTEPSTPTSEMADSPFDGARAGKHLLWDSTAGARLPGSADPFTSSRPQTPMTPPIRRSIATAVGFQHTAFPRRIASTLASSSSTPPSPGLSDSTNSLGIGSPRPLKGYSKWEKQDMEANSMSKIRAATQKRQEEMDRLEQEKKDKLKAMLPPPPTITPSITLTKPDDKSVTPAAQPAPAIGLASFAPTKPSPLASAPPLSAGDAGKPTSSFFAKPAAPSSDASKAAPSVPPPSRPNFFPNSSSTAPPASTTTPSGTTQPNFFATSTFPSSAPGASKAPEKTKAPGLGPPSFPAPTPASAQVTAASTPAPAPVFSFSKPLSTAFPSQPKPAEPAKPAPSAGGGPSLFNRISPPTNGGSVPPQQKPNTFSFAAPAPPQAVAPAPPQPAAAEPAPKTKFNFGPMAPVGGASRTTTPKPTEAENKPAPNVAPTTFNFAGQQKNDTASASAAPAPAPLTFGAAPAATQPSTTTAPPSLFGAGKLSFATGGTGKSTGASPFGTSSATGTASPFSGGQSAFGTSATKAATNISSSPFGSTGQFAFGAPTGKPATPQSAFGANSTSTNPHPFSGGQSGFGGTTGTSNSAFGTGASTSAFSTTGTTEADKKKSDDQTTANTGSGSGEVKSVFGSGFGASSSNDGTKSMFGTTSVPSSTFGTSGIFGAADKDKGKEKEKEESAKPAETKPAPTFGTSNFFGTAPKEGESKPSLFGGSGFGAPSTTKTSSPFGAAAGTSAFGAFGGAAASPFGVTKPAESSSSSSDAKPAPPATLQFGGASAFGTPKPADGPASSPFAFGNTGSTATSSPFGAKAGEGAKRGAFSFGNNSGATPSIFGKTS